jgi:eukaryotic-like serine/threonine-protein kinase
MGHSDPDARLRQLLAPGSLFEQKYRVVSKLGTGSFAIVVKAKHEVMGREVALKCLKPSVVRSNPEVSERFVNEVQIVSRLRHPNTVTIFDFGQTDDELAYMVLEYLEGETLDQVIDRQGALGEERVIHICRQILKSLAEAHTHGIIHRDLKPSNIMLTQMHGESDFVKVLDFGVAKLLEESDDSSDRLEPRSTQFIGTPVYMSPEQVLGKPVTAASDLYSLGLIFYEMLTGQTPLDCESVAAVVREHLEDSPLPLDALDSLAEPMQRLIRRATARQPAQRFRTVAAFARALPVEGVAESIERAQPTFDADAAAAAGLGEESSEADVFSGKNYVAPPEPEPEPTPALAGGGKALGAGASAARGARAKASPPKAKQRQKRPQRPSPSPSSGELDLDLESVERQRRKVEHKRRAGPKRSRRVDGGWEAREYWRRLSLYSLGAAAGYAAFVLLGAMFSEQSQVVRLGMGGLMVLAAVAWSAFSTVQAVGVDFGRRWLVPSARHLMYIFGMVLLAALLWRPAETAEGLRAEPAWFVDALPQVPPLTWLGSATAWGASQLAPLFEFVAAFLPY